MEDSQWRALLSLPLVATQYKVEDIHTLEKSFCVIVSVLIEWSGSFPSVVIAHPMRHKPFANKTLIGATVGVSKEKQCAPLHDSEYETLWLADH